MERFGVHKGKLSLVRNNGEGRRIRMIRRKYRRNEQGEKPCCLKTENTQPVYWLEG
jgi:hypothetical protein